MIDLRSRALPALPSQGRSPRFADSIAAIGRAHFERQLLGFLNDNCGADHLAIFHYGECGAEKFASISLDGTDTASRQSSLYIEGQYWRQDPMILQAQRDVQADSTPIVYRLDVGDMPMSDLRDLIYRRTHIRDRILICGRGAGSTLALSILRSEKRGAFSPAEIDGLTAMADTLLSVLHKHCEIKWESYRLSQALASLVDIERRCAMAHEQLPRREIEVCARILYGLSTIGIALDLGIGEETVMTYRKRIYQRLSIKSHRELLLWYMALWSDVEPAERELH